MDKTQFQIENGNFTRILNSIIDNLFKIPFKGCEFEVAMFIIRKTYGFNKTEDQISLSQFCCGLNRSRPSIVKALKNLQLVNIVLLVKQGNSKKCSNLWKFNKYNPTWQLVKIAKLVKHTYPTSKEYAPKLVKRALHTKDTITKDTITKERHIIPPTLEMIQSYCSQRNNKINPQYFLDRNSATGWMYGKTKMKDWQAVIRTWEKHEKDWGKNKPVIDEKQQKAISLVKQCEQQYGYENGAEIAMFRFSTKYGKDEMLKYKGIFKL